jgi:prefoldin subunit 5
MKQKKTDKAKQLFQLYNRSQGLVDSLVHRSNSDRDRDVATRYNILRADVKRVVNDPDFDRTVPAARCLKLFPHIFLAFLILSLAAGLAYYLLGVETLLAILVGLVGLAILTGGFSIPWLADNDWFRASTIRQIWDRALILRRYLQDYINLNPALGLRAVSEDDRRLERELEALRSVNREFIEELEEMEHELERLEEQLTELRQRESTYLSIIKEAQTSTPYSPSPKDREILLDSYRRQRTILLKNLTRCQEAKVKHGLNVPIDILNAIDHIQEELKQIEATIADLEAGKTDTNKKP